MPRLSKLYRRTRKQWLANIHPQKRICEKCGSRLWSPIWGTWAGNYKSQATVEHVVPRSHGGAECDTSNWALFCYECNNRNSHVHGQTASLTTAP